VTTAFHVAEYGQSVQVKFDDASGFKS